MDAPRKGVWRYLAPIITAAFGTVVIGLTMKYAPDYGGLLFILLPIVIGVICTGLLSFDGWRSYQYCFWISALALYVLSVALLVFAIEGVLCIAMAAPLALLPLLLGVGLGHMMFHGDKNPSGTILPILILGAVGTWAAFDYKSKGAVAEVRTAIEMNATPERIWEAIVNLRDLPEPKDWLLRSGMACPQATSICDSGVGATRTCVLSTGPMPERITVWEPGHRLGFVALDTPPPLKELNPFHDINPPHQHGYYKVLYGEFLIEPLTSARCRVTRITRYENNIRPAFYWNWWCNLAADHAQMYVLEAVRSKAEAGDALLGVR